MLILSFILLTGFVDLQKEYNLKGNVKSFKEFSVEKIKKGKKSEDKLKLIKTVVIDSTKKETKEIPDPNITYTYDKKGNIIEMCWESGDCATIDYVYNKDGKIIEKQYNGIFDDDDENSKYDEKGILIEYTKGGFAPSTGTTCKYSYDKDNNVLQELCTSQNAEFNMKDKYKITYNYEFDKNNNWIKQTKTSGKNISVIIREIEYK